MYFEIKDLQVYYRAIHALKGISLNVNKGEIVGPDRRKRRDGKSSTLNSSSGFGSGDKTVRSFIKMKILPDYLPICCPKGIVQVPEGRHIFPKLTVQETWKWVHS